MNGKTETPQSGLDGRIYYKCSACGVIHDGTQGAPKACVKCDNDKFYKVTQ